MGRAELLYRCIDVGDKLKRGLCLSMEGQPEHWLGDDKFETLYSKLDVPSAVVAAQMCFRSGSVIHQPAAPHLVMYL